jgi:hypothetical protein
MDKLNVLSTLFLQKSSQDKCTVCKMCSRGSFQSSEELNLISFKTNATRGLMYNMELEFV